LNVASVARWRVPLGFIVGAFALGLARPTASTLATGAAIACAGEGVRIWAAGHLVKGREVTRSGPYRYTRHPLYLGSALMATGLAVAANSLVVALVVAIYLAVTYTAAIRTEEAVLRARFTTEYDAYTRGTLEAPPRVFSLERMRRNREHRAVLGLVGALGVLALKVWW
jgi:protein-S-isoprenylcysteine O-methyltransferase Ste14